MLYVLADEWMYRRTLLRLLGAGTEALSPLDDLLATPPEQLAQAGNGGRARRVLEFAALTGGEVITTGGGG